MKGHITRERIRAFWFRGFSVLTISCLLTTICSGFRTAVGNEGPPRFVAETVKTDNLSSAADCKDGWSDGPSVNGIFGITPAPYLV